MQIIIEVDTFDELYRNSWSGAIYTLDDIMRADKEDELIRLMEDVFYDETPTETEVNDWLWFDRDWIYESLGLDENGELPTDEEDE